MNNIDNYFQTLRRLKFSQLFYKIYYKFMPIKIIKFNNVKYSFPLKKLIKFIKKKGFIYSNNFYIFNFLNIQKKIDTFKIEENKLPKLWIYNLHYFDYLNDYDNSKSNFDAKINLIYKWIEFSEQSYITCAFEPYPTSLRIVNWIKWIVLNDIKDDRIFNSLYSQLNYLNKSIEYHILANHLFANAKALIFGGMIFKGKEAKLWLKKGFKILKQEISNQILKDGGHFEQSPMYHNIIFEDLLDIINLLQSYNRIELLINLEIFNKINNIAKYSNLMCHPDGEVSFFNDSCFDIAPKFIDLDIYLKNLKIIPTISSSPDYFYEFKESGYSIFKNNLFYFIFDRSNIMSKYQPGHTHADILSFELSFNNKRFLVNSGINTYENNVIRHSQRSSTFHNTLTIEKKNSTQVWHAFRTGKRAKIIKSKNFINSNNVILKATHNGYLDTKFKATHTRSVKLSDNIILFNDFVIGKNYMNIDIFFHFSCKFNFIKKSDNSFITVINNYSIEIITCKNCTVSITDTDFYPSFGITNIKSTLLISKKIKTKQLFITKFIFTKLND